MAYSISSVVDFHVLQCVRARQIYAEMAVFLYLSGHSLSPFRQSPMLVGLRYTLVVNGLVLLPMVGVGVVGAGVGSLPTAPSKSGWWLLVLEVVVLFISRCRLV